MTPELTDQIVDLAARALRAQTNFEPLFVTRHEYWKLKRLWVTPSFEPRSGECPAWELAVVQASKSTGIHPNGTSVALKVVDKLAATT